MALKDLPPVLLPIRLWPELERMSRVTLMDVVWSMATRLSGQEQDAELILRELRQERDLVLALREQFREAR